MSVRLAEPDVGATVREVAELLDLAGKNRARADRIHRRRFARLLKDPKAIDFVARALRSTDARIHAGKPVSPGFLFAALLWDLVNLGWQRRLAAGNHLIPALNEAIDEVIDQHLDALAIQRRFVSDMREIWLMQPRFEKRQGATVHRLLEHIRFRAGYDFMLLSAEAGQCDADIAQWWTDFIDADQATRAELISDETGGGTWGVNAPVNLTLATGDILRLHLAYLAA